MTMMVVTHEMDSRGGAIACFRGRRSGGGRGPPEQFFAAAKSERAGSSCRSPQSLTETTQ